ncbi:hypothetical protein Ciccas_006186 [Cichlidogyrus casuarinus]|uniref:Protein HID1 n=1 Tax=Cichlidogyrus casuarinus TaxID=1844966 RepID=A0ABD2Q6H0_9PLAT
MGGDNSKLNFRNTVVKLTSRTQPVDATDNEFWNQFWDDCNTKMHDIFVLIPASEIRALRVESPSNLATLCYKLVEKISQVAESSIMTPKDQQSVVLNCIRLLTRILPYIFEDPDWRSFFWSLPNEKSSNDSSFNIPLAQTLLAALCHANSDEIQMVDSCEHIWQAGVGFAQNQSANTFHDSNRGEILKLLLTCFSETMYLDQDEAQNHENLWIKYFTSSENRHALPLFASLLNILCAYDPVGFGLPYNHLVFNDPREPLVEAAAQILCVVLEPENTFPRTRNVSVDSESSLPGGSFGDNLFVNYMSRIHRDEDFAFILSGMSRLLNNPLIQTYLPGSTKKVQIHQELLILFWRMCDVNKKFMYHVLKSAHILDILVPVLYHLNNARSDQTRLGLVHVCVFILLLLSGERNFGVRLNKSYLNRVPMDLTVFTGTHADLLIIVFHKVITTGHQRLQPLFECLMTILVNISPYLKTLSMVSSTKLVHLIEAFSQTWFLYAAPNNHQLVFFLLEIFNNIIQYQFDGNSNLCYTLIRKRHIFYHLANLPTDMEAIAKATGHKDLNRMNRVQSSTTKNSSPKSVPGMAIQRGQSVEDDSDPLFLKEQHPTITRDDQTSNKLHATLSEMPTVQSMTNTDAATESATQQMADNEHLVTGTSPTKTKLDSHPDQQDSNSNENSGCTHSGFTAQNKLSNVSSLACFQFVEEAGNTEMKAENKNSCDQSHNSRKNSHSLSKVHKQSSLNDNVKFGPWYPTAEWVLSWKSRLPLQTIIRMLQVLVPQVEQICINRSLTDESEIIKFLQNGTLVGLLPVPHPILIRKYQPNAGTFIWFRNYMWGVIYLRQVLNFTLNDFSSCRNVDPPIWFDTNVKLFEIQRF